MSLKKHLSSLLALVLALIPTAALADPLTIPNTISAGQAIQAAPIQANFAAISLWSNAITNSNIKSGAGLDPAKFDLTKEYPILRAASNRCFSAGTTGDTNYRAIITSDGVVQFGAGGVSAVDTFIKRMSSGYMGVTDASTNHASLYLKSLRFAQTVGGNYFDLVPAAPAANRTITVRDPGGAANVAWDSGTPAGTAYGDGNKIVYTGETYIGQPWVNGGRVYGTTGAPVGETTLTSTLYWGPIQSFASGGVSYYNYQNSCNAIALYDSTKTVWRVVSPGEVSFDISGLTAGTTYNLFGYLSGNTMALEAVQDTGGVQISIKDGVPVKSGDNTRRWLAKFQTISSAGTKTRDTPWSRLICNVSNRIFKPMHVGTIGYANSASHSYATAAWRVYDANVVATGSSTSAAIEAVFLQTSSAGVDNLPIQITLYGVAQSSVANAEVLGVSIDGAATPAFTCPIYSTVAAKEVAGTKTAYFNDNYIFGLNQEGGYHTFTLMEYGNFTGGGGTATWKSDFTGATNATTELIVAGYW